MERVQAGLLGQTLSAFGITGLYITFVFGIGRFLRLATTNLRMRIPYEDLPNTARLISLCQVPSGFGVEGFGQTLQGLPRSEWGHPTAAALIGTGWSGWRLKMKHRTAAALIGTKLALVNIERGLSNTACLTSLRSVCTGFKGVSG
jgi:Piezo non-specific cation channel, R-Ras-binding domain